MGRNPNEILTTEAPEEVTIPDDINHEEDAPQGTINTEFAKKSILIPRLPNSKNQPPLTGQINCKAFSLPRGKVVEVSPEVYEVVANSLKNELEAEDYYNTVNAELLARAEQEAANLK